MSDQPIESFRIPPTSSLLMFISHSTKDEAIVRWLVAQIEAAGHRAWVAEWDHRPGQSLTKKVADALRASDAYIVLLTEGGYDSIYVAHEAGAALTSGKPVIALVDQALSARPLGMLTDIEQVRFDRSDLAASTSAIIAGLTRLSRSRGVPLATRDLVTPAQPSLLTMNLDVNAEFHLTADQVLVGITALMLVAGVIYLASRE